MRKPSRYVGLEVRTCLEHEELGLRLRDSSGDHGPDVAWVLIPRTHRPGLTRDESQHIVELGPLPLGNIAIDGGRYLFRRPARQQSLQAREGLAPLDTGCCLGQRHRARATPFACAARRLDIEHAEDGETARRAISVASHDLDA